MIPLLPTFHGMENEIPYVHIREFEEVVATSHNKVGAIDTIRPKFFPFSLKERAKRWLYSLRPRLIGTWGEMTHEFFKKYFPELKKKKKNALKRQISTFHKKKVRLCTKFWKDLKTF